jgi:hypothetical protein
MSSWIEERLSGKRLFWYLIVCERKTIWYVRSCKSRFSDQFYNVAIVLFWMSLINWNLYKPEFHLVLLKQASLVFCSINTHAHVCTSKYSHLAVSNSEQNQPHTKWTVRQKTRELNQIKYTQLHTYNFLHQTSPLKVNDGQVLKSFK